MFSRKNAVVFPGQGSQSVGMLKKYFDFEPEVKKTFMQASNVLNINLIDLINEGTQEELTKTVITQPLMLVADIAIWKLISPLIKKPTCVAGHSLGEYSALVASGIISFEDSLELITHRAYLMQHAVPEGTGAIAAIVGLEENKILEVCNMVSKDKNELVDTANINSPQQIVIAGTKKGVDAAIKACKLVGAKRAVPIAMNVPSHCKLMKPASEEFSSILDQIKFNLPEIPIINNVDANFPDSTEILKTKLVQQFYSPVRWIDTIQKIENLGVKTIIECGPGRVLTGLTKRISNNLESIDMEDYDNFKILINE